MYHSIGDNMRQGIKETQNVEFKSSWRSEYLKTICAFANTEGGELIIGIDDKGTILGVTDLDDLLVEIPNRIKNRLGIVPDVKSEIQKGKEIIIVSVSPSYAPISYDGKYYIRSGSNTFELKGEELTRFLIKKTGKSWDEYIEEKATLDDIDFQTVEHFKLLAAERVPSINQEADPIKILEKLNLLEEGKLKKAAILLFGKNPRKFYLQAFIKIGKFKTETDVLGSDDIEGNLFQQVERTMEVLRKKYLMSEYRFEGLYRKEILEYPPEALREAIINAVIHRDYVGSAHTQIKINSDHLWIWNDGTLPPGMMLDDLKKSHGSKPRNKLLADVFFKASLIEAWGRGTIKMVKDCIEAGLPEPEYREEQGGFAVYFYKDVFYEENLKRMGLNDRQIIAIKYVQKNIKISNQEYQNIVSVSKRTATNDLDDLVKHGIFEKIGTRGKGTAYQFKKSIGQIGQ